MNALKKYEMHNKLLKLWAKLFPDVVCNSVDTGKRWIRLMDKSADKLIMFTTVSMTAWRDGVIILRVDLDLLPFDLKPETLRPNQVRGREVDQNVFEFDSKL